MYTLTKTGVTLNGKNIPSDPRNRDWVKYQEWVKAGNTPAPMPAAVVQTIDEEYDGLSDWIKELIGPNVTGFKNKVAARRP